MSAQAEQIPNDVVLSAIRRGVSSLPDLKQETGFDYGQLQIIVFNLEHEWRAIERQETTLGFDRYYPMPTEKIKPEPMPQTAGAEKCGCGRPLKHTGRCSYLVRLQAATRSSTDEKCGCGRVATHNGRCGYRRNLNAGKAPALAVVPPEIPVEALKPTPIEVGKPLPVSGRDLRLPRPTPAITGNLQLYLTVNISVQQMAEWGGEEIVEFFRALSTVQAFAVRAQYDIAD